jgi:rubrerythrin
MKDAAELYRGYKIEPDSFQFTKQHTYQYTHLEYCGPDDNRLGFGETIEECKLKIDNDINGDDNSVLVCQECDTPIQQTRGEDPLNRCPSCGTIEGRTKYVSEWELQNV